MRIPNRIPNQNFLGGIPIAVSLMLLTSSETTDAASRSGLGNPLGGILRSVVGGDTNPVENKPGESACPSKTGGLISAPVVTPKPYVETETTIKGKMRGKVDEKAVPNGAIAIEGYPNRFRVGVPNFATIFATQETPETCWAACAEMVLAAQGVHHTQDRMVRELQSRPGLNRSLTGLTNNVADLAEISGVIEALDPGSEKNRILATALNKSMHGTVRDLASGVPVIACLSTGGRSGHAYVIESMTVTIFQPSMGGVLSSIGALQSILEKLFSKEPWNALRWFPWAYNPLSPNEPALVSSQLGSGFALRDGTVTFQGVELVCLKMIIPDMTKYRDMYFSGDDQFAQARICVHEVTLADPFPGAKPRVTLSGEDFNAQLQYLIRVRAF